MRNILLGACCLIIISACKNEAEKTDQPTAIKSETTKSPRPVEFADQKYIDMGKKSFQQFISGDIDGWASGFADDIIFRWSAGDSLAGKEAIVKYWKDRRMNVINSLQTSNDIWLPVTVNEPQATESKGTWLLNWHQVKATYKNNETLTFWVHIDMHYNNDMKIDQIIQYLDRAPINAAVAKKK
jgi:hypothetical protein